MAYSNKDNTVSTLKLIFPYKEGESSPPQIKLRLQLSDYQHLSTRLQNKPVLIGLFCKRKN